MSVEHGWPMGVGIILSGVMISRNFPPPWVLFAKADTFIDLCYAILVIVMQVGFFLWGFGYFVAEYKLMVRIDRREVW